MSSMAMDQEYIEIKELVEENHKILKGLQTRARLSTTVNAIKWIVIIGITLGVYTFIQPFFAQILDTYTSIQESAAAITEIKDKVPNIPEIPENFLDLFKKQ